MKILQKLYYRCFFELSFYTKKRKKNSDINNFADLIVTNPLNIEQINLIPKVIWLYWEGDISELVQACISRIRELHPDYSVHVLNPINVRDFCTFDFEQTVFKYATPQQRADLIRFNLIYEYGGIWLDASIIIYDKLNWINELILKYNVSSFAYYRAKNTTIINYPVIENWLLASTPKNNFYLYWFNELLFALKVGVKNYIKDISKRDDATEIFQEIGRLEYLVAYVACQKVMRDFPVSMVLVNCDENAFKFQVSNHWIKEKVLIDLAINIAPDKMPKLIKLAGKERKILEKNYVCAKFFSKSLLDI